MRRSTKSLIAAAAVAATPLAVPAVAPAANPYTAKQICGPSYFLAQDIPLRSNNGAVQMGRLKLLFSGETGKSCGVLLKTRQIGRPTFTQVSVARSARKPRWIENKGFFSYYAGPVYAKGTPACVRIGGYMNVPNGREGLYVEPGWEGCPY
jgi:serine/threonine-protein kinase